MLGFLMRRFNVTHQGRPQLKVGRFNDGGTRERVRWLSKWVESNTFIRCDAHQYSIILRHFHNLWLMPTKTGGETLKIKNCLVYGWQI